ncbi:MAG: hypothetical protein JWL83_1419 [Actinomycetia bacterium]|nr:hypothetical protein [Actinomycetes bacterium]
MSRPARPTLLLFLGDPLPRPDKSRGRRKGEDRRPRRSSGPSPLSDRPLLHVTMNSLYARSNLGGAPVAQFTMRSGGHCESPLSVVQHVNTTEVARAGDYRSGGCATAWQRDEAPGWGDSHTGETFEPNGLSWSLRRR